MKNSGQSSSPQYQPSLNFWRFALARKFRDQNNAEFHYTSTRIERVGYTLQYCVGNLFHLLLREIRNPAMIVALTLLASLAVTIAFYPVQALEMVATVFPWVLKLRPWMVQFALYMITEVTILGIGMRAFGRFSNEELLAKYKRGELEAVMSGDRFRT